MTPQHFIILIMLPHHNMIAFRLKSDNATRPAKNFCSDVGYEIHSAEEKIIPATGRAQIETDLRFYFPFGYYGLLIALPDMAQEKSIDVSVSTVQNGMDTIKVMLINNGEVDVKINRFDKIAFMIINKYYDHFLILENTVENNV